MSRADAAQPDHPLALAHASVMDCKRVVVWGRSLAKAQGSLISVESVRAALGSVFSTTRDALLQIPARLSPLLAAEPDPATVQTLLYTELHQALQHLAGAQARMGQAESTVE